MGDWEIGGEFQSELKPGDGIAVGNNRSLDSSAGSYGHLRGDAVLKGEQFRRVALVSIRPELAPGPRVDKLHGNAQAIAATPHGALYDIGDAELGADFADVDEAALVDEGGLGGDHEEIPHARQSGGSLLDHAVDKIPVLGIAQIVEQYGTE